MEETDFGLKHDESWYRFYSISIGGSIWSSPAICDNGIVFGCNDTYVYSLDSNGEKMWSIKTNDMVFSSPVVYNDAILIGSNDGYLYAISKNGEIIWRLYSGDKVSASPLVVDGVVYFGSNNGIFRAVSIEDGKELWRYQHADGPFIMSAAAANDSIFFGHFSGDMTCLSKDGSLLWKINTGGLTGQTPVVLGNKSEVLCDFRNRSLKNFPRSHNCSISFASGDGFFRNLDAEDGILIWKFFCNTAGASSPLYYDNLFYSGSFDGNMYAIDTKGKLEWKFFTQNRIASSPIFNRGNIYFGSSDHNFYSVDASTGQLDWRFLTDGEVLSSPALNNNIIYFGSWDGHIYALDTTKKEIIWKFMTSMQPSFIRKPTVAGSADKKEPIIHSETKTYYGNKLEKHYSLQTGELTNTFYGSPVANGRKRIAYDSGIDRYGK